MNIFRAIFPKKAPPEKVPACYANWTDQNETTAWMLGVLRGRGYLCTLSDYSPALDQVVVRVKMDGLINKWADIGVYLQDSRKQQKDGLNAYMVSFEKLREQLIASRKEYESLIDKMNRA